MATAKADLSFDWSNAPGALELLEAGELSEERPEPELLPRTGRARALDSRFGGDELRRAWRGVLDRLRGFRKDEVLADRVATWVPLVEIHPPAGGSVELTLDESAARSGGVNFKLFGLGFGTSGVLTVKRSLTFPAAASGKLVQIHALMTATRYANDETGETLTRVDFAKAGTSVEYQVENLTSIGEITDADLARSWDVVDRLHLANAADSGVAEYEVERTRDARWKTETGFAAAALGFELNAEISCERSELFLLRAELPYGHDYAFFRWPGETPLVPRCARLVG